MQQPYFTLSKKIVLAQYDKVKAMCDAVSYSSKTNQLVTRMLEEERDCLFSVHLENELQHNKDMSRVLFLAQGLEEEQLDRLLKIEIDKYVIDNEGDLDFLLDYLSQHPNVKIELMLRTKLKENSVKTERYFVFGMTTDVVNKRIMEIKGHKQITSLGIHFHRKTQNMAEWNLAYEIEHMFTPEVLDAIDVMNTGGGLPSVYANTNEKVFESIYLKIEEFWKYLKGKNITFMMEPGRYIAAPAGKLHTHIKLVFDDNIIVTSSVYNTDMDAVIVPVKLLVEGELEKGKGKPYVIKGETPCSMDLFRYRVWLDNPKQGDPIIFLNAGAYNFRTDFCDLEELETKVIE